jgi:hypothetical protein
MLYVICKMPQALVVTAEQYIINILLAYYINHYKLII